MRNGRVGREERARLTSEEEKAMLECVMVLSADSGLATTCSLTVSKSPRMLQENNHNPLATDR